MDRVRSVRPSAVVVVDRQLVISPVEVEASVPDATDPRCHRECAPQHGVRFAADQVGHIDEQRLSADIDLADPAAC
jgi:hypothetical protein